MTTSVASNFGYNIGAAVTECGQKKYEHLEHEAHRMIDEMKVTNIQIKIMSDATNKLANAKQKDKKFNISNDEIARKCVYLVHLRNPSIFENKIQNLPVEESNLEQKLNEIIKQMHEEGVPEKEIHLGSILERFHDQNICFEVPLDESAIDVVVQGLDAELKMLNADLNKQLMNINSKIDDRAQLFEILHKILKEYDEETKAIIRKTGRGG